MRADCLRWDAVVQFVSAQRDWQPGTLTALTLHLFVQLISKAHHRWQIMEATDSSDDITAVVVHFKH